MVFAGVGCFAKMPHMKDFEHKVEHNFCNEKYYTHKKLVGFSEYATKNGDVFSASDPVTKCTIEIYNVRTLDLNKIYCVIRNGKDIWEYSDDVKYRVEGNIHIFSFGFNEESASHFFSFLTDGSFSQGKLQSFEVR